MQVADGALPVEFRIFVAGVNATEKGDFLFDADAAAAVMAAREAWGVDVMIDLEHLSLDDSAPNYDPDARGWAELELRDDGSLWAVNVRWTPDGSARLTEKRQRYISPAFAFDDKGRPSELVNVAITALPATHSTPALVAARRQITPGRTAAPPAARRTARLSAGGHMTLDMLIKVAKAMGLDTTVEVDDLMAQIRGEKPAGDAEPDPGDPNEPAEVAAGEPPEKKPAPMAASALSGALTAKLAALTGKTNPAEQAEEIEKWRGSHVARSADLAKLAVDRAALETAERHGLVVQLVTSCGEKPATAWADDTATKPAEPWASMPLVALRARVAKLSTGKPALSLVRPPAGAADHGLSARELAQCKTKKIDPAAYAAKKAEISGRQSAQEN